MATAFRGEPGVIYRPLPVRPDYFAGDDGSIWSFIRGVPRKRALAHRWKAGGMLHLTVTLRVGGRQITYHVGRLILDAFVGPCPAGMECCHWDGNPLSNRADNLRWDTPEGNAADRDRHGRTKRRLSEEEAKRIVALRSEGMAIGVIARLLKRHRNTVQSVTMGRTFSRVTGLPKIRTNKRSPIGLRVGETHPAAKLNAELVRQIRRRVAAGEKTRDIATELGTSQATVSHANCGRTWGHIK